MVAIEDEQDREAAELLAKWDLEHCTGDDDSVGAAGNDDGPLDMEELYDKYRRPVVVTDNAIDHVVLGCCDVRQAMQDFAELTGVEPIGVISLNGMGTASARVAFEDGCTYLDIVGPDPKQEATPLAEKLSQIEPGKFVPVHYAIRSADAVLHIRQAKVSYDKVTLVDGNGGEPVMHDYYVLSDHQDGGLVPNLITWPEDGTAAQSHPAGKLPIVGNLEKVHVKLDANSEGTKNSPVHKILDDINDIDGVQVELADEPGLEIVFSTTKGETLTFSSNDPFGIAFPKEGGLKLREPTYNK